MSLSKMFEILLWLAGKDEDCKCRFRNTFRASIVEKLVEVCG